MYVSPVFPYAEPLSFPQAWVGSVTQLIPPNYGIVDGSAFYVHAVVQGGRLPQVGRWDRQGHPLSEPRFSRVDVGIDGV